jgi:hypothetical protein
MSYQDVNREMWNGMADQWVEPARRDWASPDPGWGIWRIPEADVGALPDVDGLDAIELGCGTAYFSAWLARRAAGRHRPVHRPARHRACDAGGARHRVPADRGGRRGGPA